MANRDGGKPPVCRQAIRPFSNRIRLDEPVIEVRRSDDSVEILSGSGTDRFDRVIFATHADTTEALLGSAATDQERAVLGRFKYSRNRAVLHTDQAFMPKQRRAWASWNVATGNDTELACVTYWMNQLQNLSTPSPVFVTLNPPEEPRFHEDGLMSGYAAADALMRQAATV